MLACCPVHASPGTWTPHPTPSWGTNLRGGTMCFVACQKQSLPAHYIYSMSCSRCCNTLSSENGKVLREKSYIFSSGTFSFDKHLWMLHSCSFGTAQIKFLTKVALVYVCVSPPPPRCKIKVNNNLFRVPPPLSCPLSWPTRPLPVLFGHWRLSVGVYVQFTGAERSQFHVLLWNKTSLPLRSDEKWSGWAGRAGSGTVPWRRPAVRKSKRLLCRCCRLRVW